MAFVLAPLLIISPKAFEAVLLRIGADLAGFIPAHAILDELPGRFPAESLVSG